MSPLPVVNCGFDLLLLGFFLEGWGGFGGVLGGVVALLVFFFFLK